MPEDKRSEIRNDSRNDLLKQTFRRAADSARAIGRWLLPEEGDNDDDIDSEIDIDQDDDQYTDQDGERRSILTIQDRISELWHRVVPRFGGGAAPNGDGEEDYDPEYNYDIDPDDILLYDDSAFASTHAEPPGLTNQETFNREESSEPDLNDNPVQKRPIRIKGGTKRRSPNIHSPYAKRIRQTDSNETIVVSNAFNTLQWSRTQGLLVITENNARQTDGDQSGSQTVEVSARLLTDRVVPLLVGVMEAIDDTTRAASAPGAADDTDDSASVRRTRRSQRSDQADNNAPWWRNDLPYMIESGQNTFIWYRNSRKLQITREKRLDDRGLMLSGKSVLLHVDALDISAKPIFEEILKMRSYGAQ